MLKVLVVIPTHDRQEFYPEATASAEQQTYKAHEIVVTGNVGPGVRSDAPLCDRLNNAIEQSDCDAFVILCDDDLLNPDFLEKTVERMEQKGVDIVYTDCAMFGDRQCNGYALGEWNEANINRNTVPLITSLCSKRAWEKAGGFEPVALLDWDFWWKCFHTGATASYLRGAFWRYRRHAGQDSNRLDLAKLREETVERHKRQLEGLRNG